MGDRVLLRMALRAFPRRFRRSRSAEIHAVLDEAAANGDRSLFGPGALVDFVLAGWSERWRGRPPIGRYLSYRLVNRPLPVKWHAWMRDDVDGWVGLRIGLWSIALIAPVVTALTVLFSGLGDLASVAGPYGVTPVAWLAVSALVTNRRRREILRNHGFTPDGAWLPPASTLPAHCK